MRCELDYTVAVKHGGNSGRNLGALLICALIAVSIQIDLGRESAGERAPGQVAAPQASGATEPMPTEPPVLVGGEITDRTRSTPDLHLEEPLDAALFPQDDSAGPDLDNSQGVNGGEAQGLAEAAKAGAFEQALKSTPALDEFGPLGLGDKVMPAEDLGVAVPTASLEPKSTPRSTDASPGEVEVKVPVGTRAVASWDPKADLGATKLDQVPNRDPIILLEPATLVGRLLVDPGVPKEILRVELEELLPTHGKKGRFLSPVVPNDQGVFTVHGIQPGLVALRISLWGTDRALVWVDEIELGEAEQRLDPSDCEVSLLGRLQSREVEVLDEFGLRIEPAVCFSVESRNHSFGTPRIQTEDVTPRIWMERNGVDLLVLAPDREPRRVSLEAGSKNTAEPLAVALQRMTVRSLELRFLDRELLEGLPPGFRLQAKLLRTNGLTFPWDAERHCGAFDDKGKLRLEPADCGQFEVHLGLISPSGSERPLNRIPEVVEILPATEAQHAGRAEAGAVQVVHLRGFSGSLGVPK